MARREELEIEIGPSGQVKAYVKGVPGKKCTEYAKIIEAVVGKITGQELTAEYYQPEPGVEIKPEVGRTS